jgi:hypothetical protein
MASWAEKKRKRDESKRVGRPRKDGAREPNGQPSRSGRHHEPADKVAIEARARQMGITVEQAKDQKAASFVGYLNIIGPQDGLSTQQYEAAVTFQDLYRQYQRTIKSPGALYDPNAMGGEGLDPDAYADWVKRVGQRYNDARKAIQDAQFDHKHENLWAAVDYILIREQPVHTLIGATRLVCNSLARHFKIGDGSRKAA